jgi:REP element-mobilizing transposase RayT
MPRQERLNAHNIIYHVFARGNNRTPIFYETSDYQRFLKNLERYRVDFDYRLYAYCLMPNHFHLLLQTKDATLSKIMQVLMTAYTMYVNKKRNQVGHVFQGRFRSIAVEKETYFLQVLRYIHLNPVKAGLVDSVQKYPWSSYGKYIAPGSDVPTLDTAPALGMFSKDSFKQKQLFAEFTAAGLGVTFDPEEDQVRGILGSEKFMVKLTKVLRGVRP